MLAQDHGQPGCLENPKDGHGGVGGVVDTSHGIRPGSSWPRLSSVGPSASLPSTWEQLPKLVTSLPESLVPRSAPCDQRRPEGSRLLAGLCHPRPWWSRETQTQLEMGPRVLGQDGGPITGHLLDLQFGGMARGGHQAPHMGPSSSFPSLGLSFPTAHCGQRRASQSPPGTQPRSPSASSQSEPSSAGRSPSFLCAQGF